MHLNGHHPPSVTNVYILQGSEGSVAVITFSSGDEDIVVDGDVKTDDGKVYAIDSCTEASEDRDDR